MPPAGTTLKTTLPRVPEAGAQARRLLDERFGERVPRAVLDDARTVLSELVNNAYVHGEGEIELMASLRGQRLRIEVVDQGAGAAVAVREAGRHGGGHGLRLVSALAADWGAFEGTTHVWAELHVQRPHPAATPAEPRRANPH